MKFDSKIASKILLINSFESVDRHSELIPSQIKFSAAKDVQSEENISRRLIKRTNTIYDYLLNQKIPVNIVLGINFVPTILVIALFFIFILLGTFTSGLGESKQINLLSVPILSLIFWNIGIISLKIFRYLNVFVVLAENQIKSKVNSIYKLINNLINIFSTKYNKKAEHYKGQKRGFIVRSILWILEKKIDKDKKNKLKSIQFSLSEVFTNATNKYINEYLKVFEKQIIRKVKIGLNLYSIGLCLGIILGMYFSSLTNEYRVNWESTFLNAHIVEKILNVVLTPAANAINFDLPTAIDLSNININRGSENAGQWIHLWSLTAIIFIIAPRAIMLSFGILLTKYSKVNLVVDYSNTIVEDIDSKKINNDFAMTNSIDFMYNITKNELVEYLSLNTSFDNKYDSIHDGIDQLYNKLIDDIENFTENDISKCRRSETTTKRKKIFKTRKYYLNDPSLILYYISELVVVIINSIDKKSKYYELIEYKNDLAYFENFESENNINVKKIIKGIRDDSITKNEVIDKYKKIFILFIKRALEVSNINNSQILNVVENWY